MLQRITSPHPEISIRPILSHLLLKAKSGTGLNGWKSLSGVKFRAAYAGNRTAKKLDREAEKYIFRHLECFASPRLIDYRVPVTKEEQCSFTKNCHKYIWGLGLIYSNHLGQHYQLILNCLMLLKDLCRSRRSALDSAGSLAKGLSLIRRQASWLQILEFGKIIYICDGFTRRLRLLKINSA